MNDPSDADASIKQDRLWRDNGWTARVIKNNDDDGWAVEMIMDGQAEPALVGPWTVVRRHEQHLHALHHKEVGVMSAGGRISVTLDIVADEDDPHALLAATDAAGERLAEWRVGAGFRLNAASARAWIDDGLRKPASGA